MSDLSEIVGDDVTIAPESAEPEQTQDAPATTEAVDPPAETVEEVRAKTVPLAALHEAREKARQTRAEFEAYRQQQTERDRVLEQRLEALRQAQQPQPPAFDENPAEHLRQKLDAVAQGQQYTQQQIQEFHAQQQRAEAERILSAQVIANEQEFAAQAPDYHDALQYMRAARVRELQVFGVEQDRALQQANNELRQHAFWAAAHGHNPAEMAYKIAESRGYSRKPAAPSAADRLHNQQRGVAAARSMGQGSANSGSLTIEALASMSNEDFAAATKGGKWQKLMGG